MSNNITISDAVLASLTKTLEEQTAVVNNLLGITAALIEELLSTRGEEIVNDAPKRDLTGRIIKG